MTLRNPLDSERAQDMLERMTLVGQAVVARGDALRAISAAVAMALSDLPAQLAAETVLLRTEDHPPVKVGWGKTGKGTDYVIWISEAHQPVPAMDRNVTFHKAKIPIDNAQLKVRTHVIPRLERLIAAVATAHEVFAEKLDLVAVDKPTDGAP
jgi:hypothetical protein